MSMNLARVCVLAWMALLMGCASTDRTMTVNPLRLGFDFDHTSSTFSEAGFSSVDVDSTTLGLQGGYRVIPHLEVGAALDYSTFKVSGSSSDDAYQLGPQARFYFVNTGQTQPWVSLGFGIASLDDAITLDGTYYEVGAGVSYFASPWAAVEASVTYADASLDSDPIGGFSGSTLDIDGLSYNIGLSVFF